jgi:hypothetical protein
LARSPKTVEPRDNKRRGGRRGAPMTRGRGLGTSKRSIMRCTTSDSMDMKAMQNGLRVALVSAEGNGDDDDVDDSERPPSPTLGGPPISVGIILREDCEDHSASSIEDCDE